MYSFCPSLPLPFSPSTTTTISPLDAPPLQSAPSLSRSRCSSTARHVQGKSDLEVVITTTKDILMKQISTLI
ncbi:hypothetical protein E2C01_072381 [Portunus trituberculatus]|uniref:Uncharacterized protein n=1 Tax=Portunus trituberculatus TaxID=210409 RepID=A0A5B7I2H0_PORTR|nr:hypothetical protein [Portunus trituberculatus]